MIWRLHVKYDGQVDITNKVITLAGRLPLARSTVEMIFEYESHKETKDARERVKRALRDKVTCEVVPV